MYNTCTVKNNLSLEEERNLILDSQKGDIKSRNTLIESYIYLIIYIAKKYLNFGVDIDDLIGEGNLGLIKAIENYNLEMETKFSVFAFKYIEMSMLNYIKYIKSPIKIPNQIQTEVFRLNNTYIDLKNKLNREPTENEILNELNLSNEKYIKILECKSILERSSSIDDESVPDIIVSSDEYEINQKIERENLMKMLSQILTKKELEVIKLKFGFDEEEKTLVEISKKLDISQVRVRNIEKRALLKIKNSSAVNDLCSCI